MRRRLRRSFGLVALMGVVAVPSTRAQVLVEGGTLEVNGFEMYLETMGQGEPLLLVHGWSGNSSYFQPLLNELATHYRLIIPELRGHGRSTNPGGTFTTRQGAADLLALMERLDLERVRAVGASAGALILMHMASESPGSVEKMILVGAGTHFPPHCKANMEATNADSYSPEWWEIMRERHAHGDEQIRQIAEMLPALAASETDVAFTPDVLARIQAPTFIVHGDSDWCFPPSLAANMHQSIPESLLWVIPRGEHVPILGDHASQFLRLALDFLEPEGT